MKHTLIIIFLLFFAKTIFAQDTEQKVKYAFGTGFEYAFGVVDIYPADGRYVLYTTNPSPPISQWTDGGIYSYRDHKTYTSFVNFKAIFPKPNSESWGMVLNTDIQKKRIWYWDIDYDKGAGAELQKSEGEEVGYIINTWGASSPVLVKLYNDYIYQNAWALNTSLMFERRIWDKLNLDLGAQIGFNFEYENCYLGSRGYFHAIDSGYGDLSRIVWSTEKKSGEWRMENYPELMPITYGLNGSLNYPVEFIGLNLLPEARFRYEMTHKINDQFNVSFNFSLSCAVIF